MKIVLGMAAVLFAGLFGSGCAATGGGGVGPENEIRFIPIPSETLFSVRYEAETKELTVVYRSGDVADFLAVPPDVYEGLLQAADPDAYFRDRIATEFESRKFEF